MDTTTGEIKETASMGNMNDDEDDDKDDNKKNLNILDKKENEDTGKIDSSEDKDTKICNKNKEYYVSIKKGDFSVEIKANSMEEAKELLNGAKSILTTENVKENEEKNKEQKVIKEDEFNLDELLKSVVDGLPKLIDETLKEKLGH